MRQLFKAKILSLCFVFIILGLFILFPLSSSAFATTIVLDPGHSLDSEGVYDDPYNIYDDDYPNYPEINEVWNIAKDLQSKLQAAGYTVVMTKNDWNDPAFVSLYQRAQIANNANADLAVSIHDDHTQNWSSFAQVYVQNVNYYRDDKNGNKVTFAQVAGSNASSIASKSQQYGQIFASERTAAEGHTVIVATENFAGRAPIAAGNIPQVQLFSKVPWVYNEVGGIGITSDDLNRYEQGLLNAIEKAVPPSGGGSSTASGCFILNENNLPAGFALPAACESSGGTESTVVQKVIALAQAHLKTGTYVWGAPDRNWASENPTTNAPTHFDCSGFAGWSWYWGSGGTISMAGQTNADWDNPTNPHYDRIITNDEASFQPGDLIYFNFGSPTPPDHVGIYVGKDTSKYSCGADDCFIQYYQTGLPGNEVSLKSLLPNVMGVIRIKNP